MENCHTDKWNVLIKLTEVLRWLKSAKHSSTADKQGFVKALPSLPLGSCSFLNGWAEATGRALLRLVQPWPSPKLREKLQVKPWLQIQQNSRKSSSLTLLWELGGRDSAFFQKKVFCQNVPCPEGKLWNSYFCNTCPLFVKTSFPHILSSEWPAAVPTSSEQSHVLSFSGRDFRPVLATSSLFGRLRGCLKTHPTFHRTLPHPWRLRATDWGFLLSHKKWERKILMSHFCSLIYLFKT